MLLLVLVLHCTATARLGNNACCSTTTTSSTTSCTKTACSIISILTECIHSITSDREGTETITVTTTVAGAAAGAVAGTIASTLAPTRCY